MPLELRLTFSDSAHVAVSLYGRTEEKVPPAAFASPLDEDDLNELRWYVEDYGTGYRAEPDDQRAATVRDKLQIWGTELFAAVFKKDDKAAKLFDHFRDAKKEGRILSIAADHPAVLSLPWELLVAPDRSFLFNENPPVSIRRGLPAAEQECVRQPCAAKSVLHLLFIISRPDGTGFINPRSDAEAVLAALEQQDAARVEVEFLRLATLGELKKRLQDSTKAPIDIIHFDGHGVLADSDSAGKEGRLLFEGEWGGIDNVSGKAFGDLLNSNHTGLVVLSACQSAMMDSEDPMSGVAAQLVHAGIPAVIAMSYSALVTTTELLFAEFYRSLFKGRTVVRSLDEARHVLCSNLERGKRLRGAHNAQEITLELHDWFLPALYQSGADQPLFSTASDDSLLPKTESLHNLPDVQESGFFGRSWELWQIERFFAVNHCRRISITGFGGQGKTALALEAGRWLLRTKLFQRACLVRFDSYQGSDPVSMAVSTMSALFEESLPDAAACEASLERVPTLLILDNLETLTDSGTLDELLDAAAQWSEAGESRVLLTSRQPDFQHPAYPLTDSYDHRHIALQGLHEDDAVNWFDEMYRLLPKTDLKRPRRDDLVILFKKVGFHPLSISLLAQQLKERGPAKVGERLEALLEEQPANQQDRSLLASLELSIERLPERCREWLPRLGVFQGGCLEVMVGRVTGIEEADWQELRSHLLRAGLMQDERLPVVNETFLRFHPTLAPALWQKLSTEEQSELTVTHWRAYYQLSQKLYVQDSRTPYAARDYARVELANLLRAVFVCLEVGQEEGPDLTDKVNRFLNAFGMQRERQTLVEAVAQEERDVGSQSWFLFQHNLGEQLLYKGQSGEAERVFRAMLKNVGEETTYNRCLTLHMLGRCLKFQVQHAEAKKLYLMAIAELSCLKEHHEVEREIALVQTDLGEVLRDEGNYKESRCAYKIALEVCTNQNDYRQQLAVKEHIGTLALVQNDLAEAEQWYQNGLESSRLLNEPDLEAVFLYQFGLLCQKRNKLQKAEQMYRESARLREKNGVMGGPYGAATSWDSLACVIILTGRPKEAESWYRKAIAASKQAEDQSGTARIMSNLAGLLWGIEASGIPSDLSEAQTLAEDSLAIKETLDPVAAEIWKSYELLTRIANQKGDVGQAAAYRAKSRQAYFAFPGWRQQLHQHERLIAAVVALESNPVFRSDPESALNKIAEGGQVDVVTFIRRILDGERDEATLSEPLDYENAAVIRAILEGIAEGA